MKISLTWAVVEASARARKKMPVMINPTINTMIRINSHNLLFRSGTGKVGSEEFFRKFLILIFHSEMIIA